MTLELYASDDGGFTWKGTVPNHLLEKGGGDPIVGFSARGTALGVALGDRGMWVVSEAVIWRVKPASMRHTDLSFTATVEGRTRRP